MLAIFLSCLPLDFNYYKWKWMRDGAPAPQLTQVLDDVLNRHRQDSRAARNVIIADWHSWRTLHYYLHYHPAATEAYAVIRDGVELVRGPLNGLPVLEDLIVKEYRQAVEFDKATRVWVVVTKLDQFAGIASTSLATEYGVYEKSFATQDPTYHPELIELQFQWPAAGKDGVGDQ